MARSAEGRVRGPLFRRLVLCALASLLLAAVCAAWVGWQALQGARELQAAAVSLRSGVSGGGEAGQEIRVLTRAGTQTSQARRRFEDPLVRAVADLPRVGAPLQVASSLAVTADAAVSSALLPLTRAAGPDAAGRLLGEDGVVDVGFLAALAEPAERAAATLAAARQRLGDTRPSSGIGRIDAARTELGDELGQLDRALGALATAARLGPDMLGADRPRRYLLIAQSPAEARGTGGLVGGFVLLEANRGSVRVLDSGPNSDLGAPPGRPSVIDLGPEFDEHYGHNGPTLGWVNSNLSPHFPFAARIWDELWQRQSGQRLDGFLAVDPTALSYLLDATGPVALPGGERVTAANVVDLMLRDVYQRFNEDTSARDAFLQQVNDAAARKILGGGTAPRPLLTALGRAARERRLLLWSPNENVEDALGDSPLSGRLPNATPAVGDVIVNAIASKLDYYLERRLAYAPGCGGAASSLTLSLRNGAPATGLPSYVTLPRYRGDLPPGTNRSIVTLYVPVDAELGELRQDGTSIPFRQGTELGLRWVEAFPTLRPGESTELALDFRERVPAGADIARVEQPLVQPEEFSVRPCG